MRNPIFSIIAPAIHRKLYKRFYDSISVNNKIPFEIIFIGHKPPIDKMPKNFYYINTRVKPAQCIEIGARQCNGDYIIQGADDMIFSNNFLNLMYKNMVKIKNNFVISAQYRINGKNPKKVSYYFDKRNTRTSPHIGMCSILNKKIWMELGGIDNRFIFYGADLDLIMRFYEYGKKSFILKYCYVNEVIKKYKGKKRLSHICGMREYRKFLDRLWLKEDRTVSKKRLLPVLSFNEKNILLKSQGKNINFLWD